MSDIQTQSFDLTGELKPSMEQMKLMQEDNDGKIAAVVNMLDQMVEEKTGGGFPLKKGPPLTIGPKPTLHGPGAHSIEG